MSDGLVKRDRSPAFPSISLKDAVDRLIAFEKYFGRHPAPVGKAGMAWNLKTADQTIAALRYFGLLDYVGRPGDRQVAISEDGRNYLRAQQPSIRREILRRAALRPKEIKKFWEMWGADRPPNLVCVDELVLKNSFSDRGARVFLRVYDTTISFSGLADSDKTPRGEQDADGELNGDEDSDDLAPDPPTPPPASAGRRKVLVMEGERELTTGLLSKGASFRLIVSGNVGVKEIEMLIKKLQIDKEILADEPRPPPAAQSGGAGKINTEDAGNEEVNPPNPAALKDATR